MSSRSRKTSGPTMRGSTAGMLILAAIVMGAGIGLGIGALVGAAVPLMLVGFTAGFFGGIWVVAKRFSDL